MLKFLMKDKNGNLVSVPEDKLEVWLQSQKNQKDNAKTNKEIIENENSSNNSGEIDDDKLISGRDYIELDKKTLNSFEEDDCMFFKFAGAGAMGEGAGVLIMMKDGMLYHTNYMRTEITQDDLIKAFPFLDKMRVGYLGHISGLDDNFQYVDMGMGNGLLVRNEIYTQFKEEIQDMKRHEIYNKWVAIAKRLLGSNL